MHATSPSPALIAYYPQNLMKTKQLALALLLSLSPIPAQAALQISTPSISMHDALTRACHPTMLAADSISWGMCWTSLGWSISELKQSEQDCILAFTLHNYTLAGSYALTRAINLDWPSLGPKEEYSRCLIFTTPQENGLCILVLLSEEDGVANIQHYSSSPRSPEKLYTPPLMEYSLHETPPCPK